MILSALPKSQLQQSPKAQGEMPAIVCVYGAMFCIFVNAIVLHGVSRARLFSFRFGCPERPLRALGEAFVCLSARREGVLDMLGLKEACQGQVTLICRAQRSHFGIDFGVFCVILWRLFLIHFSIPLRKVFWMTFGPKRKKKGALRGAGHAFG